MPVPDESSGVRVVFGVVVGVVRFIFGVEGLMFGVFWFMFMLDRSALPVPVFI